MAISPTYPTQTYQQPTINPYQSPNGVFTKFVNSEQEVTSQANPLTGCSFYMDGDKLILYVKYADGRPMEIYDLVQRELPKPPNYLTVEEFNKIMDAKLDELSRRFVIRKERNNA